LTDIESMPRKRTGSLVWTGKQFSARIAGAQLVPLLVADKRIARARLRELVRTGSAPTTPIETFEAAARRIVASLEAEGMVTAVERLSRLERFAFPLIGSLLVTEVKPGLITALLEDVAAKGKSRQTVVHVRNDISKVFAELIRDEVLVSNPAKAERVRTPRATVDKRKRALLTDAEFIMLVTARTTREQLRVMAICSRAFGGMRTSDLHEFRWTDIDLIDWAFADVPRPKTEHLARESAAPRERIEMPLEVVDALRNWRAGQGEPTHGPVFPEQKHSYARDLRYALRSAGILRHELHHPTETTKPVDFHSFRRAFVTAVGAAGLNAQTAMRLTGHRTMATHMRYNQPDVLQIPGAAVPKMPDVEADFEKAIALFNPGDLPTELTTQVAEIIERPQRDLNPCYRRERPESKLDDASKFAQVGNITEIVDLNDRVRNCPRLRELAIGSRVVDSKLAFQRAADAALSTYLRGWADAIAAIL
jgi:integrase